MDFFEAIEKRRSVRKYTEKPVPAEVINKALDAALKAPNSSNLQPWEFYWVRSKEKKEILVKACLDQNAAKTAGELIVAVARMDTWDRNRKILLQHMSQSAALPKGVSDYYNKIIPFIYRHDPFHLMALFRFIILNCVGMFRPMFRKPAWRHEQFEVVTKTTALACENFMLAIAAQSYGSCPMEGFDESRVKYLLNLNSKSHIVMVISVGETADTGILGDQFRIDRKLTVFEI
ncbi:MAG: nitroreductase family protein [Bdellovibrionales bacterium]|nr:nitroreductase family protein [Bdellovibrionales bacterium]